MVSNTRVSITNKKTGKRLLFNMDNMSGLDDEQQRVVLMIAKTFVDSEDMDEDTLMTVMEDGDVMITPIINGEAGKPYLISVDMP